MKRENIMTLQTTALTTGTIDANLSPGENMDALALRLASIATPTVDEAVAIVVKAKDDWDGGPIAIMHAALKDYPPEVLQTFPDPDVVTGNNPAVYMVPVYKDGKRQPKDKEVVWYNRFADGRPASAAILARIEQVIRAGNDKMKQDGIPEDIADMNPDQRDQEKIRLNTKLGNNRKAVKNAFKLMFKIRAVNMLENVECYVVPGSIEGTYENLIHVNSTVQGRSTLDYDNLTISTFNRLNVAKAIENGGSFKALMATKKRAKTGGDDKDNNEGDAKPHLIRTIDTLKARTTDYAEYFDVVQSATDKAQWMELLKQLGPKGGEGTDQFAHEMRAIFLALQSIYKHDAIRARGDALITADITGETKAA